MGESKNMFGLDLKEIFQNFQKNPVSLWILLGVLGLGLVFLVNGNDKGTSGVKQTPVQTTISDAPEENSISGEVRLERELTRTLQAIKGVGTVRVDLNLKAGNRRVWERQSHINKRVVQEQGSINTEESTTDDMVFAKDRDGRDTPILKEELAAEIQGVIIVASGASDSKVKLLLTNTVMTILGLPAHRVLVIPGEKQGRGVE
jgi:stage III sporulation protein AG